MFMFEYVSGLVEYDLLCGVFVIEVLEKLLNIVGFQKENMNDIECKENVKNGFLEVLDKIVVKNLSLGKK